MDTPEHQTDRHEARIQRIAHEALRRSRGHEGWDAYEVAKGYVRRQYGAHIPGYDAIIDRIKDELEI
jgi:hypothetical protein